MAMSADPIGQLLRREGHLPLTIEDRPRLDALLAAHPALLAGLRDALALAAQHFPAAAEIRVSVKDDPDYPEGGCYVVAAVWTHESVDAVFPRKQAMTAAWLAGDVDRVRLPLLLAVRYRER